MDTVTRLAIEQLASELDLEEEVPPINEAQLARLKAIFTVQKPRSGA